MSRKSIVEAGMQVWCLGKIAIPRRAVLEFRRAFGSISRLCFGALLINKDRLPGEEEAGSGSLFVLGW